MKSRNVNFKALLAAVCFLYFTFFSVFYVLILSARAPRTQARVVMDPFAYRPAIDRALIVN